jgi:pimeloyl-ACP methyl ester carboxylesterase
MVSRRTVLGLGVAAGATTLAGGAVHSAFRAEMDRAEARIATGSTTIPTRSGRMEYAEKGGGRPILMIHGTGGGFDQGLHFAAPLVAAGYRVIAPSRFGYLGSDFPADAGTAAQADAFVDLLDALGIERLPVAGGSAGALPAIEFAIRHPDRCSALVAIVPATYAPERPTYAPMGPVQERAMRAMLGSDFLFWAALRLMRDQMIGTMLATDPALVHAASAEDQARVDQVLRNILPVSRRQRGLMNDAVLAANPAMQDLGRIVAPTLAVSLEDDRFGTYDAARYMVSKIPGARLVGYPTGGHVWVGHDAELFAAVDDFLKTVP